MSHHPSSLTPLTQPSHLISLSISHILRSHRFTSSTVSAHLTLTTLLERYISLLATTAVNHAANTGRNKVSIWDVIATLDEFGMGVDELKEWCEANKDEQGGMASLGVTSGLDGLRDHIVHHPTSPPIPLLYKRVRIRHPHHLETSLAASPRLSPKTDAEPDGESDTESRSDSGMTTGGGKRKRGEGVDDVDGMDIDILASSPPPIPPWLPPLPSLTLHSPPTPHSHSPSPLPMTPPSHHSQSPATAHAPTPAPQRKSAAHPYLASPVEYTQSMLHESHSDSHLAEVSTRLYEDEATTTTATTTVITPIPPLLPPTTPSLIEAYESLLENLKSSTADEIESSKGGLDHRIGIVDILSRTSNHPMAYSGVSSHSSSTDVVGNAIGMGTSGKGNHFIPSYPIYQDGSVAEEYPVKRVMTSSNPYVPTLAYSAIGSRTSSAPLSNPTNPSTFKPLHIIVSELPGKMKLARSTPQSSQFWFEPTQKRSEWLTPDILDTFTHMQPPPPLIGKKGTAEEDRKLLYGEGIIAPGWTREMKVPSLLRMEDDLPTNAIGSETSSWVNPTVAAMTGKSKGREHGEEELSRAATASMTDTAAAPITPLQPMIQLKSTWDIKDRGNWRVWVKPGSKTRGRVLSKSDGHMLDINVKGEDVEEEMEDDEEDESTTAGTFNTQNGHMPIADINSESASTPGPRLKLVGLTRPEQSIDSSAATTTPRLSFSMPPPSVPTAMESQMSTPAPFKLKFKLGGPLTPTTPATPSIRGPARQGFAEAQLSHSASQDYFSLGPREESSADFAAQSQSHEGTSN